MAFSRLTALFEAAVPNRRADARSDAELLTCFLHQRDEAAFEALLLRHTPAVRAACRGWLRAPADIDDAAQATFLVLVQRAGSIRNRAALGGWLCRVAVNVSRRLQRQRPRSELALDDLPAREPAGDDGLGEVVAQEVARLPEKYRLPVQLCYWAGLTTAEAADRLGWPKGTVLTRLAWARQRLQKTLSQRGVAPAALAGVVAAAAAPNVSAQWLRQTAHAARCLRAGAAEEMLGVSARTLALTKGVVRSMFHDRLKYVALAMLVAVGLAGFGIHLLASGPDDGRGNRAAGREDGDNRAASRAPAAARDGETTRTTDSQPGTKADDARPSSTGRRREAVIRLPSGTYAKEVDAAPYGSGRLTWTYEDERVVGLVEGSVMGFEFELATESEYSLSSNGTIYGLVTGVRLNHLKVPDSEEFKELKPFAGLWPAFEPLVNDVMMDLPFSYQFRIQGDRLIISNYRILLAGPNPLGKLGGLTLGNGGNGNEPLLFLTCFQALGTAIEGTYTAVDGKEKPAKPKRAPFYKPRASKTPS